MAFDDSKFVTGDEVASIVVSKFTGDRGGIDTLHRSVPNQTDRIMDLLTQTHLTTLRDLLTYRLLELRAEVNTAPRGDSEQPSGFDGFKATAQAFDKDVALPRDGRAVEGTGIRLAIQPARDLDPVSAIDGTPGA